jgi:hypothetical protein
VQEKHPEHEAVELEVRSLPKPAYSGTMETVLRAMVPIYMTFSMAQFIGPMLMVVVDEKEKRIKESLRMVSLARNSVQCSAVQYSAVQCSAVQCSAVQCSAVQ